MAAGRLRPADAGRYETAIKAAVLIGDSTQLRRILLALRSAKRVERIIVIGPPQLQQFAAGCDVWLDERSSGEDNALAGLDEVRTAHALLCASDLPFVQAQHVDDFLDRVPTGSDVAYPIYERSEFLAVFPGGRTRFARVGAQQLTGGSACLMHTGLARGHRDLIRSSFRARKNLLSLAAIFGPQIVLRFVSGRVRVEDLELRLSNLMGGVARAVKGAHPALAMDCDDGDDIEYARARYATSGDRAQNAHAPADREQDGR
ncbi:MAG: NTP transferase domain-containing protein [Candidatus Eremiobacteraeota bacterium]|nr:NTP transferase domain-containing protein [Candidatus Eremiobacteraeota bacterium]